MAKPVLDERLWKIIEPLFPPPKRRRRRHAGRKPLTNHQALTGILFVLKTGIPWEYLPREMGCGSGMSCWRRLRDWQKAGVWMRLHGVLLEKLQAAGKIDWERAAVDSASVRAMQRGKKPDRAPWTAGNTAPNTTSWSMAKDACPCPSRSRRPTATT
jgi:transposase